MSSILQARIESMSQPEPNSGCWLWLGYCNFSTGRGRGHARMRVNGKLEVASRVAWRAYRSHIPKGLNALHKCDTPECVNPTHLWLGTQLENMQDSKQKGRCAGHRTGGYRGKGEELSFSKLTAISVREIRRLHKEGYGMRELGRRHGVSHRTISQAIKKKTWGHIE